MVPEARRGAEKAALSRGLSLGWWGPGAGVQGVSFGEEPLRGTSHLMRTHSWVSLRTWEMGVWGGWGFSGEGPEAPGDIVQSTWCKMFGL